MPIKVIGIEKVKLEAIEDNVLNANIEDTTTFKRLMDEIKTNGLLEIPVVFKGEDGSLRYIAGHHRGRACKELGWTEVDAVIVTAKGKKTITKEEEFNLVNNLNQVRGRVTLTEVKKVIRRDELDVTALDLFKFPIDHMIPIPKALGDVDGELARRAKIRELSIQLAPKIAEIILDDLDAAVIAFRVQEKMVAVIKTDVAAKQVRKGIAIIKSLINKAITEWLETADE